MLKRIFAWLTSIIRFRQLPVWTQQEIDEAKQEAERIGKSIGWLALALALTLASDACAADSYIQYDSTTLDVTGVAPSDPGTVPGHGVVTLLGCASVTWPVPVSSPSAQCTAGQALWTRLVTPASVTCAGASMIARPGLMFFGTASPLLSGCSQVRDYAELLDVASEAVIKKVNEQRLAQALNHLSVATYVAVCPTTVVTQDCIDARANMSSINGTASIFPTEAGMKTVTGNVVTLKSDVITFKNAQGW